LYVVSRPICVGKWVGRRVRTRVEKNRLVSVVNKIVLDCFGTPNLFSPVRVPVRPMSECPGGCVAWIALGMSTDGPAGWHLWH